MFLQGGACVRGQRDAPDVAPGESMQDWIGQKERAARASSCVPSRRQSGFRPPRAAGGAGQCAARPPKLNGHANSTRRHVDILRESIDGQKTMG
jgi:phage tail tape-measure protein